jgi:hypothetical protein
MHMALLNKNFSIYSICVYVAATIVSS